MRNKLNFFNIEDINEIFRQFSLQDPFSGDKPKKNNRSGSDTWERKTYRFVDGKFVFDTFIKSSDDSFSELIESLMGFPKENNIGIESLRKELQKSIENEDYELSIKIRDKITLLQQNQGEIQKLEKELSECIKKENFERAIEIKKELINLKK